MDWTVITLLMTALAALLTAGSLWVKPLAALSTARAGRKERNLEAVVADLRAILAEFVVACNVDKEGSGSGVIELFDRVFSAASVPAVFGVLGEGGRYVSTRGFNRILGHEDARGEPWTDARFVHPADLESLRALASKSIASGNDGEVIHMLNAEGARLRGRLWSLPVRIYGDRGYRLFVVLFDRGVWTSE